MKTAAIISCNDNYDYNTRTKYVCKYLEGIGYTVEFVVADFDHRNKKKYISIHPGHINYINVREYNKNLSIARIISHISFARKVRKLIENKHYDLIYHCAPPNSTIYEISKAKEKGGFYLITEIGDMWPETMPVSSIIKKIGYVPFLFWRTLRDRYLYNSDQIIAECDLFKEQLRKYTGLKNINTLYFCKEPHYIEQIYNENDFKIIEFCYLGSINNIINYDIIAQLVSEVAKKRKVRVHIIGDGEKRDEMINSIEKSGGEVFFHGTVFDDKKKESIFSKCHYALNVMKNDVYVGMTMKSLDYFSFGIPMINNIGADIGHMIQKYEIGFNIDTVNCSEIADRILCMNADEYAKMRKNVCDIHEKFFSINSFDNSMKMIIGGRNEKNSCI